MKGYSIIDNIKLDDNVTFIRVRPTDVSVTIRQVLSSLTNTCWLNDFDSEYIRDSFKARAEPTIQYLKDKIIQGHSDAITTDTGEIVVSELARLSIISELSYLDIPIGELLKQQKSGNPGFDFFTENLSETILFGEAKYVNGTNAYNNSFGQIKRFVREKRDETDLLDIRDFCSKNALNNVAKGGKGFIGAFSSTNITTDKLIENIKNNSNFMDVCSHVEIICVAVDVWIT